MSSTPLGLAEILGLAMPFAIYFTIEKYNLMTRVMAAAFIPLAVHVILLTDSRLGMVAALGSGILYLLLWALGRWYQMRGSLVGPAIVLTYPAIFSAFIAATFLVGRLRNSVWGDGSQAASDNSRQEQWAMAIPKIIHNPLGYGIGKSGSTLNFTNLAGVRSIDSYYISILLDIGVVGFLVYYGLMLRSAFVATRTFVNTVHDREIRVLLPIAVSLVNFVVVKAVLSQDANHPLAFMMVGAVVALAYRSRQGAPGAAGST